MESKIFELSELVIAHWIISAFFIAGIGLIVIFDKINRKKP